ncbi:hypothetical protein HT031_003781 [Scenedesmus sp. PABB004]|nr:hypothetical protein HT031_003781 [Scenedesmus sp. PABB004]
MPLMPRCACVPLRRGSGGAAPAAAAAAAQRGPAAALAWPAQQRHQHQQGRPTLQCRSHTAGGAGGGPDAAAFRRALASAAPDWRSLQRLPLPEPARGAVFSALAVAAALRLRQQARGAGAWRRAGSARRGSAQPAQRQQQHHHQQQQQQQQQAAAWAWYHGEVLQGCLQRAAAGGGGGGVDAAAAAALLQATAAMGWSRAGMARATGSAEAEGQLVGACLTLLRLGLEAALGGAGGAAGGGGERPPGPPRVRCSASLVVALVVASQRLGLKLRSGTPLHALRERALAAALAGDGGGGGGGGRAGYGWAVKLLQSWVVSGTVMSPQLLLLLCECVQAHLLARPALLLRLLLRMQALERRLLWPEGQQLLARFRETLLAQLPAHAVQGLRAQVQAQLAGGGEPAAGELVLVCGALAQLPAALPAELAAELLLPPGQRLLAAATRQLREGGPRRAAAAEACCFTPAQASQWLAALARMLGGAAAPAARDALAAPLLGYLAATQGVPGAWPPRALVPLLSAAAQLGLPAAAGPEWWAAALAALLAELPAYAPHQVLAVLQAMASGGFRPDPELLEQRLLPVLAGGFGQAGAGGGAKQPRPFSLPQLLDLADALAQLRHAPRSEAWWASYQAAVLCKVGRGLQQQVRQQKRQQEQQQQESGSGGEQRMAAAQAARLLWAAGQLRLQPRRELLTAALAALAAEPNLSGALTNRQLVGLFVGLSALAPGAPGALQPQLYGRICRALRGQRRRRWRPADVTNLVRCIGALADAAAGGGAGDAEEAAAQPLLPPPGLVDQLLAEVEPALEVGLLRGRALASLMSGLRKLGHRPGQDWLDRYQAAVVAAEPGMADTEALTAFTCLVHAGCAIDPALLAGVLRRAPRPRLSPGLVADLSAALAAVDARGHAAEPAAGPDGEPRGGHRLRSSSLSPHDAQACRGAPAGVLEPRQQGGPGARAPHAQQGACDAADATLGLDALIDQARSAIGAREWWAASAGDAASDEAPDPATAARLAERLAAVDALLAADSGGGGAGGA